MALSCVSLFFFFLRSGRPQISTLARSAAGPGVYRGQAQRPEPLRRARDFCPPRLPKYLQWFEEILARNPAGPRHLVGGRLSYADLSLFQMIEGLRYAFPNAAQRALARTPAVVALHDRVAALPRVAAYLRSERRLPFNEQGIFRRYPELDVDPG